MKPKLLIVTILTTLLFGCGRYYSAEIAGYVRDSNNDNGINGAIIRMYLTKPESADSGGFIAETASMTSGGNDGYYNHKIIWQTTNPKFSDEGDSGSIWISVTHPDYTSKIVEVSGIISDTVNVVPDIKLKRATFSCPTVTGKVVNVNGEGVNGVRVVLDLQSTPDNDSDYVTTTTTLNNEPGSYRFNNVTWRDEHPDSAETDTENATIYIDDSEYTSDTTLNVKLTSGQDNEIPDNITVTRKPRSEFSTTVTGRCIERVVKTDGEVQIIPLQGIDVTITYTDDNDSHTLTDTTDNNGNFSIMVQWTDSTPGENDSPQGEDTQDISIYYTDTSGTYSFSYTQSSPGSFTIRSWKNPNYLPDAEGTHN